MIAYGANSPAGVYISNMLTACGCLDWYLPSRDEIIINNRFYVNKALFNGSYILFLQGATSYWVSTEYVFLTFAYYYNFLNAMNAVSMTTTYTVPEIRAF